VNLSEGQERNQGGFRVNPTPYFFFGKANTSLKQKGYDWKRYPKKGHD